MSHEFPGISRAYNNDRNNDKKFFSCHVDENVVHDLILYLGEKESCPDSYGHNKHYNIKIRCKVISLTLLNNRIDQNTNIYFVMPQFSFGQLFNRYGKNGIDIREYLSKGSDIRIRFKRNNQTYTLFSFELLNEFVKRSDDEFDDDVDKYSNGEIQ